MESTRAQRINIVWSTTQFLLCIAFTGNFLYLAMRHHKRDEQLGHITRCTAKEGINHPINVTKNTDMESITDVG